MGLQPILSQIKSQFEAAARPEMVAKYSRYFREGYDAYGLDQGVLSEVQKDLLQQYKTELGWQGFLDLGDLLMRDGKYEEIMLAIMLAASYKNQLGKSGFERCGRWLDDGICTWAHSDVLCNELLNYFWRQKTISMADMAPWREARSKWKRRAVPVSMLALLKDGPGVQACLEYLDPMMMDEERVVHQGLGWFLREAWKRDSEPVEEFLMKWRDTAPRLIYQYATEKMSKEARERFRRPKKTKPGPG